MYYSSSFPDACDPVNSSVGTLVHRQVILAHLIHSLSSPYCVPPTRPYLEMSHLHVTPLLPADFYDGLYRQKSHTPGFEHFSKSWVAVLPRFQSPHCWVAVAVFTPGLGVSGSSDVYVSHVTLSNGNIRRASRSPFLVIARRVTIVVFVDLNDNGYLTQFCAFFLHSFCNSLCTIFIY